MSIDTPHSGPPRPIFDMEGPHSGDHFRGVLPLPLPLSILQNPGKALGGSLKKFGSHTCKSEKNKVSTLKKISQNYGTFVITMTGSF